MRSYPPLHRYRATLVVCQSLRAVSNVYAGEGCSCCGIIERTNACVRSRWLTFVQAGGGNYPPLYRYCATSSNAGSSRALGCAGGRGQGPTYAGGRSIVLWVTLRTRTLAFLHGTLGFFSDSYARERCCGVSAGTTSCAIPASGLIVLPALCI